MVAAPTLSSESALVNPNVPNDVKTVERYGRLPIYFEPNVGQADETFRFVARGKGYSLLLTDTGNVLSLKKDVPGGAPITTAVGMHILGASSTSLAGTILTKAKTNYLVGNDPSQWRTDIPNYAKVRAERVLPGIDAVYYGNEQQLEYDFVVSPGYDPDSIRLAFDGPNDAEIDRETGDLVFKTGAGAIRHLKPIAYQETETGRLEVAATYRLVRRDNDFVVSFEVSDYDRSRELVIDPILSYGSYIGGNAFDEGRSITVDPEGNAYVVGTAASLDFPTTPGVIKETNPASTTNVQWYDAFVAKIDPTGTELIFSTYYGGRNGSEIATGVALDGSGNVLITGTTMANDLPVLNAYQSAFGGTDDAFAAKINPAGTSIIYSTYLGGRSTDLGGRIVVNRATGDTVFAGTTSSGNFPTTPGAYKPQLCDNTPGSCNGVFYNGSYLVKLSASGNAIYSTLFDANILDVTLDSSDNATFGGSVSGTNLAATAGAFQPANSGGIDGFIAKLDPTGSTLVFGSYLGGGLQSDTVKGIVLDAADNIYVSGQTQNVGFPTTAGAFDQTFNGGEDGFATKLNAAGSSLVFSTFIGGQAKDQPSSIGLGSNNDVFVAGETLSTSTFPLKNSLNGTAGSIFLTRFNSEGSSLIYSTLLGVGGAYDLAVDGADNAFITGHTKGVLVTPDSFQPIWNNDPANITDKDGFVLKIAPADENATFYSISGTVTDENYGFNNDYKHIVVTITGAINRSMNLPYNGGPFAFGVLPAGGNYTVTVRKIGYETAPASVVFNNLGANQSADFTILRNHEPEGTITTPVHGQVFNSPATINIQATASDEDGHAIQKVDFVAYSSTTGSIPIGTDLTEPFEAIWNDVPVGTWALYAFPTDSLGLRGDSVNTVQVQVVNAAPVQVSITSPTEGQTFVEGDHVPISVSVSPSVSLVQVRDQNNNLVGWLTGGSWSTTWRVMDIGEYTLTATAQNSQGQTATSTPVHITVGAINHSISGHVKDNFTDQPVSGVNVSLVSPSNPSITATTVTDVNGAYSFTDLGATPNDSVTITPTLEGYTFDPPTRNIGYLGYIQHWQNQTFSAFQNNTISVTLTSPTDGETYTAPATINLAADATTASGTITKVDFYRGQLLLGTDTEAPYEFQWIAAPQGFYDLYARATDSTGAIRDSNIASIRVNPEVTTVRLQGDVTTPGGGWMAGITLQLTGMANGNPINRTSVSNNFGAYGFFNLPAGGDYTITPQGTTITFTPPSASFTNVSQDIFDIDFEASAANQSPSVQINSPTDGAVFTMPAAIPVSATSTDIDGTIVRTRMSAQSDTMFVTIGETLGPSFSALWQPNQPGTYTIWASALDKGGLQTSTSITITVNPPFAITISGRTVDRNSVGIEGATVELREFNGEVVSTVTTDADGNYSIPNITTFMSYELTASKQDYSFSPQKRTYFNLSQNQNGVDFTGTLQVQPSDFDGDGKTDIAVWRPSSGVWYVTRSRDLGFTASQFGGGAFGDVVVPGNYDGDKKIDYAVFRNGIWYIQNSSNNQYRTVYFGLSGDKPTPGDYDGDGRTDIAVWRPSNGFWYIMRSSDGSFDYRGFGMDGDIPVAGDFDADGMTDVAVWRPNDGSWYVLHSSDGSVKAQPFGLASDIPVTGDFDGDKRIDFAVFRPSDGNWYVLQSSNGAATAIHWGMEGDKPVAGDYDHDGKTDYAIFRPSTGTWYVYYVRNGGIDIQQFGVSEDVPIPGAFLR